MLGAVDLRWRKPDGQGGGRGFGLGLLLGAAGHSWRCCSPCRPAGDGLADQGTLGSHDASAAPCRGWARPRQRGNRVPGLPLVLLAGVFGRWPALVALAVVFALAHGLDPHATPLAIANIALAGILLGVAFFAPGGIWTAFGAHLGWNAALAAADAPVSGMPFTIPFIDHHAGMPVWLTGGAFGPEGA